MTYTEETLTKNETIIATDIQLTRWEYGPAIVATVITFGLLAPVILYMWLRRRCTEYAVTSRRVVTKTGILSRNTDELRLASIESVQVRQGIAQRMCGYGNVVVTGRGNQTVTMVNVLEPARVKTRIEEAADGATSHSAAHAHAN